MIYNYGFASRTEYLGETYRVVLHVDMEKPFIIHAPAGTYAFLDISQSIAGIFGEKNTACVIENPVAFDIREGKTTYIGNLIITAAFMTESERKVQQSLQRARGVFVIGRPEALLTMKGSVIDHRDTTFRELGLDQGDTAMNLNPGLMRASEKLAWNCEGPAVTSPPRAAQSP